MSQLHEGIFDTAGHFVSEKSSARRFALKSVSQVGLGGGFHAHMGMSMTRGAMVFMAFWRAAICFLMLSSSWCSLFWEQPQTGAGVGGGGGGRVGAGVGGRVGRGAGATN